MYEYGELYEFIKNRDKNKEIDLRKFLVIILWPGWKYTEIKISLVIYKV